MKVTIDLPDDLASGECDQCPLGWKEEWFDEDDGYDFRYNCVLDECPIEGEE